MLKIQRSSRIPTKQATTLPNRNTITSWLQGLRRPPFWLWMLLLATIASAALLWPLPLQADRLLLDNGDALHEAWVVRNAQERLLNPSTTFFAAPANYPSQHALAFNPPLYTSAVIGIPFYLLGWSATGVYNLLIWLSFVCSWLAMALLARHLTNNTFAGVAAGLMYAFAPVRLAHLVHLNLLNGFWSVLLLYVLLRWWSTPTHTRQRVIFSLSIGVLGAAQVLADVYNGIYLLTAGLLLVLYQLLVRCWKLTRHDWQALAGAGTVALLITLPIFVPTLQVWRGLGLTRNLDDHDRYGARLEHYLVSTHDSALGYDLRSFWSGIPDAGGAEHTLWPGLIVLGLAVMGLIGSARNDRRTIGYFVILAVVAFGLSFGPTIRWGTSGASVRSLPYHWLFTHAPLFSAARIPSRWALLAQLPLAVLAAYGITALQRIVIQITSLRRFTMIVPLLVFTTLILDHWPRTLPHAGDAASITPRQVDDALRTLPPGAMLEWPLSNADPNLPHRYEYATLNHHHPIVNSASSIVSQRYESLMKHLQNVPSDAALALLRDLGVRYINVNRYELGNWSSFGPQLDSSPALQHIGSYDNGAYELYELLPSSTNLPAPVAEILDSPQGRKVVVHVYGPLWLASPSELYGAERNVEARVLDGTGRFEQTTLRLPPVLLPGTYVWNWPLLMDNPTMVELADYRIPLLSSPSMLIEQPASTTQLTIRPLPKSVAAGSTIPCQSYGIRPVMQRGIVLSVALTTANGEIVVKRDHFFDEDLPAPDAWSEHRLTPAACALTVPTNIPAGDYTLTLGLYDPEAAAPVPFAGPNGDLVPAAWRIPTPITIHAASEAMAGASQ